MEHSNNKRRSSADIHRVWRPPGFYEIPNILGNHAYLKPELPHPYDLRPLDTSKHISKRPWYSPSPYCEIPELRSLTKHNSTFAAKVRKILPKDVRVRTTDPRLRFHEFQDIGTGVNGAVVRAVTSRKGRVAIKRCTLHPDAVYRAAVIRELFIMASRLPQLIHLQEVVIWNDDVWMVMDLMRCSVFAVLCRCGLPENHAIYITRQTLRGLAHLHRQGYLHRDIKSENILLGWDGQVKLADFGLSSMIARRPYERLGTNKWMAPEVIREEYYNEKIDMWSLGITLIEMMDRVPPHYLIKDDEELFRRVTTEPGPTFTYSFPSVYVRGLVAWLLDENPQSRPSAQDVILEIDIHVKSRLLSCSSAAELAQFLNQLFAQG